MINKFAWYFEYDCKNEAYTSVQKKVWIFFDGTVRVDRRFEMSGRESSDFCGSLQEFADAYPVLAAQIFTWMRENGHNVKEIEFPSHNDLVPLKKKCVKCHEAKALSEFPENELSFDGTHNDCCACRIRECQEKKMRCQTPLRPKCLKCPVLGERKDLSWTRRDNE
jgi:hypothetical protein